MLPEIQLWGIQDQILILYAVHVYALGRYRKECLVSCRKAKFGDSQF